MTLARHVNPGRQVASPHLVLFQPGLAQKPRLWPGSRGLRLGENVGQAKAPIAGLAPAWLGPGRGFSDNTLGILQMNWVVLHIAFYDTLRYNFEMTSCKEK